jgi:signal transduction histidine kinase
MSRELHDIVAQGIAEGIIKAQLIEKLAGKEGKEEVYREVSALESILVRVLNEVRSIIFEERPVKIERKLFDQLRRYMEELNRGSSIEYRLVFSGDERLISQRKIKNIFFIVREALANIRRHSGASSALVELNVMDDGISLIISDDGKGFDMNQYENKRNESFGIKIMEERSELLGGSFKIESSPGKGTRIEVNIPL